MLPVAARERVLRVQNGEGMKFRDVTLYLFLPSVFFSCFSKGLLQEKVEHIVQQNQISLARHDVDVKVGGRTRQEGFFFDKPLTFRSDYNDQYSFMRSKVNLDFGVMYGRRTFHVPAVVMRSRLTAFNVWDNVDVYVPIIEEPVSFSPKNFLKKAEVGEHHHDGVVTQLFLEEGWLLVRFDPLFEDHEDLSCQLKVGYFPYKVGRGVSLGDYFDGAINYLGWQTPGNPGNGTQRSPGLMLSFGRSSKLAFELYYSKWKKRSHGPDFTREEVKFKRLDTIPQDDTQVLQRGVSADRDLFVARVRSHFIDTPAQQRLYVEPYAVYVNAPELEVEQEGDASAQLWTVGCMAEYQNAGFRINLEVAGQFGHHTMHAIDRNHVVLDDAYYLQPMATFSGGDVQIGSKAGRLDETMGFPVKYHSHILLGVDNSVSEYLPYRAYYVSDELQHVNRDRSIAAQGQTIKDESGAEYVSVKHTSSIVGSGNDNFYSSYQFKTGINYYDTVFGLLGKESDGKLHNANIPFGGGTRFRPKYTLECRSFMMLLDACYTFPRTRWTLAGAVGYVSGDDYPFNTEVNKTYQGFIPFKDANYDGRFVKSYGVFAARKIGRPSTFSDTLLYAPNNTESLSNLRFLGVAIRGLPFRAHRVGFEVNAIYFWEDQPPFTWDRTATRSFSNTKLEGIYQKAQTDLHFTGHQTTRRAQRDLGLELNAVITWRPVESCEFRLLGALFLPGKLYSDVRGTPNAYTIRVDTDGDYRFDALGTKMASGVMFRVTYWF